MRTSPSSTPYRSPVRSALLAAGASLALLAVSAPLAAQYEGFLYGTVTTEDGKTFRGLLRWGDEEAFWDDLFNSAKTELPWVEEYGESGRREGRTINILGHKIRLNLGNWEASRHFVVRFGDIDRIEPTGRDGAMLTLRDGTEIEVRGAANDVDATIGVKDSALGEVGVPWRKIRSIQFAATPKKVAPGGFRLWGKVATEAGPFEGWIQWDKQECLSYDVLDGEEDGIDLKIKMGTIQSIERNSRSSSRVTLKDGREMVMEGTNDVNDDNRGILVEDKRFGRVEVPWSEFERVDFREQNASGAGYGEHGKWGALHGTVTTRSGKQLRGRLVYDLDEAYGWEMLDGNAVGITYSIPMGMVRKIEPRGDEAVVTLRGGEELRLGDTQDVSDANDGVLVLPDGAEKGENAGDPVYVGWDELRSLELDW